MNLKEIEKIIQLIEKSSVNQFKLEEEGFKIEILKEDLNPTPALSAPQAVAPATVVPPKAMIPAVNTGSVENELIITSPMVGTYYASSSPETPPFINVGDRIKKGDPVCIIEAMKLFNEIESEYEGVVVKILVKNESAVEFGQPLILLKKDA
ncbi:MAG: acetyl-CoA carboxylase biotin carboxyl carrier protein [Candidatus Margulisiibacteriota bacterium]|mgnify:CR=1 FL=1